ncbi:BNR repeat domain protein [Myxococcus stipitatus DSM 14675]|uniref:BNR repeat domain protein n=1 Tax=Myxococcus stipitatus (strain DSM 14675 / JCM 12634 / Mx s8) TaxID=1278073 RepID=L7U752_MYXSD|nr:putative metal-binding motif-containing protein [Myxococcus stipitatus]AGC42319.1 BNR repeat domain protein [Myxococcus stipitatus DSM 14675]
MSYLRGFCVAGLLVLGGCTAPNPDQQSAFIDVDYTPSFKTGCFVVRVSDEADATKFVEERFTGEKRTPPLALRAIRKESWGTTVKVTVAAHERDCQGQEVDRAVLSVDLSGEGRKTPLRMSLVAPDADGDGYVAPNGEKGGTDCDDSGPNAAVRFPGNPEACDFEDNDCDEVVDEAFPTKGMACNNSSCTGVWVCNEEKTAVACSAVAPRLFYVDRDGDGDGDPSGVAEEVCEGETPPPGFAERLHQDCDEVDPSTKSSGVEVCDALDNNCNGVVDEGLSCGGTLKVVSDHHVRPVQQSWKTVALGPSGYPVWIAGQGGGLAVRRAAGQKFESFSANDRTGSPPSDGSLPINANSCGDHDWTVAWVDSSGKVFLGGEKGHVAIHNGRSDFVCNPDVTQSPGEASFELHTITGMVGFEPGGKRLIYLTDIEGRLFRWDAEGPPVRIDGSSIGFYGLHAFNSNEPHAVGSPGARNNPSDPNNLQTFRRYSVKTGVPVTKLNSAALPDDVPGRVNAVWFGFERNACAVGDGGAVWRWNGVDAWKKVASPAGLTVEFSSVVMTYDRENALNPLNEQCFMVDRSANGRLRRSTLHGWGKGPDLPAASADVPLNDIAMTDSGTELWVVGDNGRVFHYPEP